MLTRKGKRAPKGLSVEVEKQRGVAFGKACKRRMWFGDASLCIREANATRQQCEDCIEHLCNKPIRNESAPAKTTTASSGSVHASLRAQICLAGLELWTRPPRP